MALPTAQLGQMASINVPSFVPTQVIDKRPKLWEQALMQMLAQAGTQAATSMVGNTFARDNASEFGEKNATGFDKLLHGAAVDDKTAAQRRQIAATDRADIRNITARGNENRLNNANKLIEEAARINAQTDIAGMNNDVQSRELDIQSAKMGQADKLAALGVKRDNLIEQIKHEQALQRERVKLAAEEPYRTSQITENNARTALLAEQTSSAKQIREMLEKAAKERESSAKPSANGIDENLLKQMRESRSRKSTPAVMQNTDQVTPISQKPPNFTFPSNPTTSPTPEDPSIIMSRILSEQSANKENELGKLLKYILSGGQESK